MKNLNKQAVHQLYKEKDFLKLNLNNVNVKPSDVKFYSPREHIAAASTPNIFS